MNLLAMQKAIDNNGRVLDALIEELGVSEKLRKRLDESNYERQLQGCLAAVEAGKGRKADAGPGTVVFGRNADGFPLAVNFDSLTPENQAKFTGAKEGSEITAADGTVITIAHVFDMRPVAPAGDGKHPATRRKGKRR